MNKSSRTNFSIWLLLVIIMIVVFVSVIINFVWSDDGEIQAPGYNYNNTIEIV